MRSLHHVSSLNDPHLQPYLTLRRSEEHIRSGIFVAEGEKVVRRLLQSRLDIVSFLVTPEWLEELSTTEPRLKQTTAEIFIAQKSLLGTIVGYRLHQGIMAVGSVPAELSLPELMEPIKHQALFVALDGLMNSENVGVVVRNCAAFGVDGIIVGESSSSPYLRRAVRNSMGAAFQIPIIHSRNLAGTLSELHVLGITIVGTDLKGTQSIRNVDFRRNICLVFGNEERGLSDSTLDRCTLRVAIPMMNQTDSLNVSSASAAFLYEVRRQRF